jgi:choline dehydrogenase-like flavoprotein
MAAENAPRSKDGAYFGELHITGEQTPNPESRVTLADETDALGVPRARLDWRLTAQAAQNLQRTMAVVAERLGAHLLGRSRLAIDEADPWDGARGSNHHMGTTRMDPDPARGVVDTDCRVHGLSNLFVAGSSVYPTVGASNPTLTLLALAVRMSDQLAERLR